MPTDNESEQPGQTLMAWAWCLTDPLISGSDVLVAEMNLLHEIRARPRISWQTIALFVAKLVQSEPIVTVFERSAGEPVSIRVDLAGEAITTGSRGLGLAAPAVSFGSEPIDESFRGFVADAWSGRYPAVVTSDPRISDLIARSTPTRDLPPVSLVLAVAAAKSVVLLEFLINMIWVDAQEKADDLGVPVASQAGAGARAIEEACLPLVRWAVAATDTGGMVLRMAASAILEAPESGARWSDGTDDRWEVLEVPQSDLLHRRWTGPDDAREPAARN